MTLATSLSRPQMRPRRDRWRLAVAGFDRLRRQRPRRPRRPPRPGRPPLKSRGAAPGGRRGAPFERPGQDGDLPGCRASGSSSTGARTARLVTEISWPLFNASDDYIRKYYGLAETFNPTEFDPAAWARLAKLAGMEYVVFTAKRRDGFCMFDTDYSDFKIARTPYRKGYRGHDRRRLPRGRATCRTTIRRVISVTNGRPWSVTNEGDVWLHQKRAEGTVYALAVLQDNAKTLLLKSVSATPRDQSDPPQPGRGVALGSKRRRA